MKDLKGIAFLFLFGLPVVLIAFVFGLYFFGCGSTNSCTGVPQAAQTPIPTLISATLPAPKVGADAGPVTPKCRVAALDLIGAWVKAGVPETDIFEFSDTKGQACTATFSGDVQKLFLEANLWYDGSPSCTTCHYADVAKATKNLDLSSYAGILAGSNRVDGKPKGDDILGASNWEASLLYQMLYAPDGITSINRPAMPLGRPATVPASGPVISAGTPKASE